MEHLVSRMSTQQLREDDRLILASTDLLDLVDLPSAVGLAHVEDIYGPRHSYQVALGAVCHVHFVIGEIDGIYRYRRQLNTGTDYATMSISGHKSTCLKVELDVGVLDLPVFGSLLFSGRENVKENVATTEKVPWLVSTPRWYCCRVVD